MPPFQTSSTRIRGAGTPPRRRASDPSIRRRKQDHKAASSGFGSLLIILVGVMFLGYVFNLDGFATAADHLFNNLNASAQNENDTAVRLMAVAYPAIALSLAAVILFFLLKVVLGGVRKLFRRNPDRAAMTREVFQRITTDRGIHPRIATQAYQLMQPFYRSSRRARLDDRLVDDLGMTETQIQEVYASLLRETSRKPASEETPAFLTMLDLLRAVQGAKRQAPVDSKVITGPETLDMKPAADPGL